MNLIIEQVINQKRYEEIISMNVPFLEKVAFHQMVRYNIAELPLQ